MKYLSRVGLFCVISAAWVGCACNLADRDSAFDQGVDAILGKHRSDVMLSFGRGWYKDGNIRREFECRSWEITSYDVIMPCSCFSKATLSLSYRTRTPYEILYEGTVNEALGFEDVKKIASEVKRKYERDYGISFKQFQCDEKGIMYRGYGKWDDILLIGDKSNGSYMISLFVSTNDRKINDLIAVENKVDVKTWSSTPLDIQPYKSEGQATHSDGSTDMKLVGDYQIRAVNLRCKNCE